MNDLAFGATLLSCLVALATTAILEASLPSARRAATPAAVCAPVTPAPARPGHCPTVALAAAPGR